MPRKTSWQPTRGILNEAKRLARAFLREIDRAILRISEAPERWPTYDSLTRRFLLSRFPFSVIYRVAEQAVEVIAVAHNKRNPGYWRPRL